MIWRRSSNAENSKASIYSLSEKKVMAHMYIYSPTRWVYYHRIVAERHPMDIKSSRYVHKKAYLPTRMSLSFEMKGPAVAAMQTALVGPPASPHIPLILIHSEHYEKPWQDIPEIVDSSFMMHSTMNFLLLLTCPSTSNVADPSLAE
jgi:hypothetical protein